MELKESIPSKTAMQSVGYILNTLKVILDKTPQDSESHQFLSNKYNELNNKLKRKKRLIYDEINNQIKELYAYIRTISQDSSLQKEFLIEKISSIPDKPFVRDRFKDSKDKYVKSAEDITVRTEVKDIKIHKQSFPPTKGTGTLNPNLVPPKKEDFILEFKFSVDFENVDFKEIIHQLKKMADNNGLFHKIDEIYKENLITNMLKFIGVDGCEKCLNMTNEQKGILAFNFAMLESRELFLKTDKFLNIIDELIKIPAGQQKLFPDINMAKDVIKNHPDLALEEKINLLKKVKITPALKDEQIVFFLTSPDFQKFKLEQFMTVGRKYFEMLEGTGTMPYQFISCTGKFKVSPGIADIEKNICSGYFMYNTTYYKFTDDILLKILDNKNLINDLKQAGNNEAIPIDELLKNVPLQKSKLKNVLLSMTTKEINTLYDFERMLNNLFPTNSKEDEADKEFIIYLLNKKFLFKACREINNIKFSTKKSFETALNTAFAKIDNIAHLKDMIEEYTINSFNEMYISVPSDRDLELYMSNYGFNEQSFNILKMTIGNIEMEFGVDKKNIKLKKATKEGELLEFMENELYDLGIMIPQDFLTENIVFEKDKFKDKELYIQIINQKGNENKIHFSANSEIDINPYNINLNILYEINKFVPSNKDMEMCINQYNVDIFKFLTLIKNPDNINEVELNVFDTNEFDGHSLSFNKNTKIFGITTTNNSIEQGFVYNIPPNPPYIDVQVKTNPILKMLSQLSEKNSYNLGVLRNLNMLKIIMNLHLTTVNPPDKVKFMKKEINIRLKTGELQKLTLGKFFEIFNNIKYENQVSTLLKKALDS